MQVLLFAHIELIVFEDAFEIGGQDNKLGYFGGWKYKGKVFDGSTRFMETISQLFDAKGNDPKTTQT